MTGGVPAAAEAPPQTRGRRSSYVAFAWLEVVAGVILVLVGVFADQAGAAQAGTIIAGITLIAMAVLTMVGLISPALLALLSFAGGAVIALAALTASDIGVAQAVMVGAAALTFLGAFGSLASSRDLAAHEGADEPAAGVENV